MSRVHRSSVIKIVVLKNKKSYKFRSNAGVYFDYEAHPCDDVAVFVIAIT